MVRNYKFWRFLCFTLAVVLAGIFVRSSQKWNVVIAAVEFSMEDLEYQQRRELSANGETKRRIGRKVYRGSFAIEDIVPEEENRVEISVRGQIGKVVGYTKENFMYTTPIHSIIVNEAENFAIICLYSNYDKSADKSRAVFDVEKCRFICVGDIQREEAVKIIKEQLN